MAPGPPSRSDRVETEVAPLAEDVPASRPIQEVRRERLLPGGGQDRRVALRSGGQRLRHHVDVRPRTRCQAGTARGPQVCGPVDLATRVSDVPAPVDADQAHQHGALTARSTTWDGQGRGDTDAGTGPSPAQERVERADDAVEQREGRIPEGRSARRHTKSMLERAPP